MDMKTVAVLGGGLMGAGIAQVFAAAGHSVTVYDPASDVRNSLMDRIASGLSAIGEDASAITNVSVTDDLPMAVGAASFITEAVPERLDIKRETFGRLVTVAPRQSVLASNSSVIPISTIAEGLPTAERIVGTHWWNPAALIPLVEVIQGAATSDETIAETMRLLGSVGKKPVHIKKDVAGFVANRLQHALWREAIAMVADGVCDARTIDDCVKHSFGLRLAVLGPLENADLVGLDLTRDIHATILPELNRDVAPNPLLDQYIICGKLGFKSGEGLQHWSPADQAALRQRLFDHLLAARRGG